MNSYLRPLIKELNSLWTEGFTMSHGGNTVVLCAALIASVCDIPATAKLGGFISHTSKNACWKCSKKFPYDSTLKRVNFSGSELRRYTTRTCLPQAKYFGNISCQYSKPKK